MTAWTHPSIMRIVPFLLAACLFNFPAQARYSGGSGTADDPYQIATAADLIALGETPADYDKHFILTADIDLDPNLPGGRVFGSALISSLPAQGAVIRRGASGYQGIPFTGVLDGNGHEIRNLVIAAPRDGSIGSPGTYVGLIAQIGAKGQVRHLGLENVSIDAEECVGAVAGENRGTVLSCHSSGNVTGYGDIGGLVGYNKGGTIEACHSAGRVQGSIVGGLVGVNDGGTISLSHSSSSVVKDKHLGDLAGTDFAGGIAGYSDGTILSSYASGDVTGDVDVGGLVGNNNGTVDSCYASGNVMGGSGAGGLVGENHADILSSYASGNVSGNYAVGGLVGSNGHTVIDCHSGGPVTGDQRVGGLVGDNSGSVTDCYSASVVNGGSEVGGLVGSHRGFVTQSYSTRVVSGRDAVGGLIGKNGLLGSRPYPGIIDRSYSTATVQGERFVGGLIGDNAEGLVSQCYSTGAVSGSMHAGGLVGNCEQRLEATACFWDTETSGLTVSSAGEGKTTAQMQTADTFLRAGWDFAGETTNGTKDIWKIAEGLDYPRLAWQKYSGSGTADDPYQIATAADLITLGETPADYDKHFVLTADIDLDPKLPGGKVFDSAVIAGARKPPFTGVFDGNGHTISHLTIVGEFSLGLFGQLGWDYQRESYAEPTCTVTNLAVEDVNIVGSVISAGALAAYVEWAVVSHSRSTGRVSGKDAVGGLVGHNRHAVINCHSGCVVIGDSDVGGLVGNNNGSVTDCHSTGTVNGGSAVGGLVGRHQGSITQSCSTGAVSGKDAVGGLVGHNGIAAIDVPARYHAPGDIDRSYSTAAVKGETYVGGLIGEHRCGSVRQCYTTGAVSGSAQAGGLIGGLRGAAWPSDVTMSFWDVETGGLAVSGAGQGMTTAQMQAASTFLSAGWDFVGETANGTEDIWWIDEGQDYPRLWWEPRN